MPNKKIALMVFSLSVEGELKNKPFLAKKNLAKSLSSHIKGITRDCGLPIIHYDENKQSGPNFGSRFSNALQEVYDEGYDAVITIGNDCPYLGARHIHQAKEQLLNGNTVIGPTFDGGFYLLGISKEDFDRTTFLGFSWNTETVYDEISQTFSDRRCNTTVLRKFRDIDHFSDIRNLSVKHLHNTTLRQIIQSINSILQKNYNDTPLHILQLLYAVPFNKGSPFSTSV